jgi:hypothetical protein
MQFTGDGPWEIPIAGLRVRRLAFAMTLTIGAEGDERGALVSLPGPFELTTEAGGVLRLDPEHQPWEQLSVLFALRDAVVVQATASSDATLDVTFSSGHRLRARSEGEFESWEVAVDDRTIVGTPGAVLVWDEDARARARDIDSSELGDLLARLRADRPGA